MRVRFFPFFGFIKCRSNHINLYAHYHSMHGSQAVHRTKQPAKALPMQRCQSQPFVGHAQLPGHASK